MQKKRLILSSLVLLTMVVTACNFGGLDSSSNSSNIDESSSIIEDESSSSSLVPSSSSSSKTPSSSTSSSSSRPSSSSSSRPSSSSSSSSSSSTPSETGVFSFDEAFLNTPQEIHTTNQKSYLNYSGDYYHITSSELTGFGMSGKSNVSAPNKVTLSWNYDAPTGKSVSKYSIIYGQKQDLSDGYQINGSTSKSISFYNPYLGDNYFKVVASFTDGTSDSSAVKVFKVATQAPRNIYAGNMPNVRDMGGRTTYAGGKIKQGLIYRGAGNKFDKSTQVNDECKNILLNQLKVKTEINVADGTGNNINLSGATVKNCFMAYGATPYSNLSRNAEKIRQVMDILAVESNYPVFYHCRIGTDRTGITGMMIGGLLGIPFNKIFQDYCFSNFAPIDGQRYANKEDDPNGDDPAKYIEEIKKMPGANYQEKTYNALLSIGCEAATLNKIINFMTEGNKATLPTTGKIGTNTDLTSTGTKKTSTDYSHPANYYECGSGKKTSYQATTTAGDKNVVVYLGSTDSSKSTKLASCIALKIDNNAQTIVDKTLFLAGFGKTTNAGNRTGYMFQILGKYNLTAGSHTFEISVNSGTFNIATIAIFDYVAEA